MNNEWHPCRYIDCTLEHDDSWVDGKWYEWEDIYGNREVARMKLDAWTTFILIPKSSRKKMSVVTERLWKEKTDVRCERLNIIRYGHLSTSRMCAASMSAVCVQRTFGYA